MRFFRTLVEGFRWGGREKGKGGGERKGEDGIRTVENRVRKRYGGKEGVKRK